MGIISQIVLGNPVSPLFPLGASLGLLGLDFGQVNNVMDLNAQTLLTSSLVTSSGGIISNFFNDIWAWILYNLLTPILIIVFITLFFIGQIYLFKIYWSLVKNLVLWFYNIYKTFQNTNAYTHIADTVSSTIKSV